MYRWIVILKDRQDVGSKKIRKERFAEHFNFLEHNFYRIVFSCGLREDSGEIAPFAGGFWIVEADSKAEVVELITQDPYYQLGLRETIDVYKAHEGYV